MIIGKRIQLARKTAKLTQAELSRRAGITSAAISMIEGSQRIPTIPVITKIAKVLELPMHYFVDDDITTVDEKTVFYSRFGRINLLSEDDKQLIIALVKRMTRGDE